MSYTSSHDKRNLFLPIVASCVFIVGAGLLWATLTGRLSIDALDSSATSDQALESEVSGSSEFSVQASLEDYSWEDLARISDEIAAAASSEEAFEIAAQYKLVNEDGTLTQDTKEVVCSDGTSFEVMLAGILHDTDSTTGALVGLSFVSAEAVQLYVYNNEDSIEGGWQTSAIRSWLQSDFLSILPDELTSELVAVNKLTNNSGVTSSTSSVTVTSDAIWLLSCREVVGEVAWSADTYGSSMAAYDSVLNAEGEQYQLFAEMGVTWASDPNNALVRYLNGEAVAWWYRSTMSYANTWAFEEFAYNVLSSGFPQGQSAPSTELGVVIGFCI